MPCGHASMSREKRSLSVVRLAKRCSFDLLSSLAQTFFSPARCETASCMLRCADQDATSFRNWLEGSQLL